MFADVWQELARVVSNVAKVGPRMCVQCPNLDQKSMEVDRDPKRMG